MTTRRGKRILETEVIGFEYDFPSFAGILYMAKGCCCDMTACINFFRSFDPKVKSIHTFAGTVKDTSYWLRDGEWVAVDAEGGMWPPCSISERDYRSPEDGDYRPVPP
jgi:hypothetical protein